MKTVWTKGLEQDASGEMELAFKASGVLRQRLAELLKEKMDNRTKAMYSDKEYENPNWAYKKADEVGYLRALSEVISVLS